MKSSILALLLGWLFLGNCVAAGNVYKAYAGAELPPNKLVILNMRQSSDIRFMNIRGITLDTVDGKHLSNWFTGIRYFDEATFLPGKH